jgi:PAS domain S-box-containing protein
VTLRRLLPVAFVLPIALGLLQLIGQRNGLFEAPFGLALFVLCNVVILSLCIFWNAASLYQSDLQRHVSEERFRLAVESAPNGMVSIDRQGRIMLVNSQTEEMFGYHRDELLGQAVETLLPERYRRNHPALRDGFFSNPESRPMGAGRDLFGRRKDGTEFPVEIGLTPFRSSEGLRVLSSIVDISERKQAELERIQAMHELEQTNTEMERFTYTVSHDLKSPLITIKGFLGMVEKDAREGNGDRLRDDLERIGNAADKMKQLLDELLELSRIGRIVNHSEDVPLSKLVGEALELLTGRIDQTGAEVRVSPELPVVHGDRLRLREVLQNLIENALKFSEDQSQPRIDVGVRDDGEPVIFVRDNGIGIDPQYAHRIFGLFEQLDRNREGTGIGLAMVKRIVELHGGRIWAESEGLGRGSTFCFTLPIVEEVSRQTPHLERLAELRS